MSTAAVRMHAQILDALAAIEARIAAIERRLPARGLRDADARLLLALADSIGSEPFTAKDVFEHVRIKSDTTLAAALREADIEAGRGLGWWARRMAGEPCDGLCIVRCDDGRDGAVWQVRVL